MAKMIYKYQSNLNYMHHITQDPDISAQTDKFAKTHTVFISVLFSKFGTRHSEVVTL